MWLITKCVGCFLLLLQCITILWLKYSFKVWIQNHTKLMFLHWLLLYIVKLWITIALRAADLTRGSWSWLNSVNSSCIVIVPSPSTIISGFPNSPINVRPLTLGRWLLVRNVYMLLYKYITMLICWFLNTCIEICRTTIEYFVLFFELILVLHVCRAN